MLTAAQNQIVALAFLNGILFLGLNFIARSLVFPAEAGSKRLGYMLIVIVSLTMVITQEYRLLIGLEFSAEESRNILLGGCVIPVFFVSLVFYRVRKTRIAKTLSRKKPHAPD